jgi:hypothetical protein
MEPVFGLNKKNLEIRGQQYISLSLMQNSCKFNYLGVISQISISWADCCVSLVVLIHSKVIETVG